MKDGLAETKEELIELISKPTPEIKVHVNCNFCKNLHSDRCTDSPNPDTCSMYEENNNISYSEKIVMLVNQESPTYFKDQYGICRIWINDNGIYKSFKLDSSDFEDYCRDRFFRTFGKVPKSDSVRDTIKALEALSRNAKTINVRNRVNLLKSENGEDEIWIDLCDQYWRSIKITSRGYEIVEKTPPIFRRFEHMEALCLPKDDKDDIDDGSEEFCTPPSRLTHNNRKEEGVRVNSYSHSSLTSLPSFPYILRIFDYLRINDEDSILIISAIVSYFFVGYPYVIVSVTGPSGRGKSTYGFNGL